MSRKKLTPLIPSIENWDETTNTYLVSRINRLEFLKPDIYTDLIAKMNRRRDKEEWRGKKTP
jgi:hypothetical protein